jgi:hypothetical protein
VLSALSRAEPPPEPALGGEGSGAGEDSALLGAGSGLELDSPDGAGSDAGGGLLAGGFVAGGTLEAGGGLLAAGGSLAGELGED